MKALAANPLVKGFTTNPSLMRKANITDYVAFAHEVLAAIPDRPVSFEVFADEFPEMEAQALEIASWGRNVYVKIPVTNTKGASAVPLVQRLSKQGVQLNVTAVFTLAQVEAITAALDAGTPAVISVFAGRIADTGVDPVPLMAEAKKITRAKPKAELLWASPRELLNIFQADSVGCHIITVTHDVLAKLDAGRQGPRRVLARDRKDVPQGRVRGGLQHTAGGTQGRARRLEAAGNARRS